MSARGRPHVLLVHDAYADYVVGLANALAEHVPVTVMHGSRMHDDVAGELSDAVATVVAPQRRLRDPRRCGDPRVGAVAAAVGADVVHLQQSNDPVTNLLGLARPGPAPRVLTVHDVRPHPGDGTAVPGGHATLRARAGSIRRFVAHTPSLARDLAHTWRVPEERVDVVAHGELGSRYGPPVDAPPPSPRRVLFFGRNWPYKGLDRLVAAVNALAAARSDLVLSVAGPGASPRHALADLDPAVGVEVVERRVPRAEVPPLFAAATVVCLPYREASQSGVHALACGLGVPVVATAVGGLAEAVHHGHDGLLVPPDDHDALVDALARVLDDPGLRAGLAAGARARRGADLDWSTLAEETLAVYRRAGVTETVS